MISSFEFDVGLLDVERTSARLAVCRSSDFDVLFHNADINDIIYTCLLRKKEEAAGSTRSPTQTRAREREGREGDSERFCVVRTKTNNGNPWQGARETLVEDLWASTGEMDIARRWAFCQAANIAITDRIAHDREIWRGE